MSPAQANAFRKGMLYALARMRTTLETEEEESTLVHAEVVVWSTDGEEKHIKLRKALELVKLVEGEALHWLTDAAVDHFIDRPEVEP